MAVILSVAVISLTAVILSVAVISLTAVILLMVQGPGARAQVATCNMQGCSHLFRQRTGAAERQDPVFLIGPRNKKTRKKKSKIKILHPPVQITSQGF
jgi:hypothetical protein